MKWRATTILIILSAILALGCERKPLLPDQPASEKVDYQEALKKNRERMQANRNQDELNQAIRNFQTAMGRSPTNLSEVVKFQYIERIPDAPEGTQYIYIHERGNVRLARLSPEQRSRLAQQKIQAELSSKAAEKDQ